MPLRRRLPRSPASKILRKNLVRKRIGGKKLEKVRKTKKKKFVPVKKPVKRDKNSPSFFKDNVPKDNYSFQVRKGWSYSDRYPRGSVENPIQLLESGSPHLVLKDFSGKPRFTL